MARLPLNIDDAGIILRRRLRDAGMNQSDAAKLFGKSRAWGSQELFSDPKKTLRRMLIDQPATVTEFARKLGWIDRDEMIAELDLFEGVDIAIESPPTRSGPPIPPVVAPLNLPLEIPDELQQVIDRHGSDYPELHNEATLRALVAPRLFAGHSQGPQTAAQWLEYFLMNRRWLPQ